MSTIAELRSYVRRQTEQTSSELSDGTIDPYLQEAFNRTIAAETSWPFYEETWSVTQFAGQSTIDLPVLQGQQLVSSIVSLTDPANRNRRLTMIDYETGEDDYFGATTVSGAASEFSLWGNTLYLWPMVTFSTDRLYQLRGYRYPTNWLSGPSTNIPDCDPRLHLPLAHYAIALSYAKQEDEMLERSYMERWQRDVEIARQAIMEPNSHRPLMMGPRRWGRVGRGRYRFNYSIETP
jgi:hypothetical protein